MTIDAACKAIVDAMYGPNICVLTLLAWLAPNAVLGGHQKSTTNPRRKVRIDAKKTASFKLSKAWLSRLFSMIPWNLSMSGSYRRLESSMQTSQSRVTTAFSEPQALTMSRNNNLFCARRHVASLRSSTSVNQWKGFSSVQPSDGDVAKIAINPCPRVRARWLDLGTTRRTTCVSCRGISPRHSLKDSNTLDPDVPICSANLVGIEVDCAFNSWS